MRQPEHIQIFDTTLRDGEQSPGCSMTPAEKLRIAHQLDRLGVDVIEAGFPISSEGDFRAVQSVAREIRRPVIAALARCRPEDIERAWSALRGAARPRIHTFLAASDIHLQHKLRISRRECLEQASAAVRQAKSLCDDVEFSPEDATRSDPEFLCQLLEAVVEAGATTLNIPDTVGYTVPAEYAELIMKIRERVRGIERVRISTHCHDDLGLAVANSLAAVQAGARQVECTINGIGERAGNAALEEVVMTMRVRSDRYPYVTSVESQEVFPTSQLITEITGAYVQANKAIVGCNAFSHEAGIHQDGMIKNSRTYEIMTPESVGVAASKFVLGKHSGRHALRARCEELGFHFGSQELDALYRQFLAIADHSKIVDDRQILALIRNRQPNASSEMPVPQTGGHGSRGDRSWPVVRESDREQQEDYLWGV